MDSRSSEAGCVAVMGAAVDVSVRYVSRVDAVDVPMSDCLGDCSSCFGAREGALADAVCGVGLRVGAVVEDFAASAESVVADILGTAFAVTSPKYFSLKAFTRSPLLIDKKNK